MANLIIKKTALISYFIVSVLAYHIFEQYITLGRKKNTTESTK